MTGWELRAGDCIDVMRTMADASIDAIVTDPPYGLGFMGKAWDALPPGKPWAEQCLRVLKPGGHLLAFGGTRTYHRLAVAIEDAGFEIRDTVAWMYGSGFPKSHNLTGEHEGWGTALKPGHEPIVVARKPLHGTVAQNVAEHGTGAINIGVCRIEGREGTDYVLGTATRSRGVAYGEPSASADFDATLGRWPANVVLDDDAAAVLDDQSGVLAAGNRPAERAPWGDDRRVGNVGASAGTVGDRVPLDAGGASRFFYVAKPTRAERENGLDGFVPVARPNGNKWTDQDYRVTNGERPASAESGPRRNVHPTVKPIALMEWLVRLVTPPGGVVLDPFVGSGTTGIAAVRHGFGFIGIEREPEYYDIARARILGDAPLFNAALEAA